MNFFYCGWREMQGRAAMAIQDRPYMGSRMAIGTSKMGFLRCEELVDGGVSRRELV
uniref:Uncharacterized protein n=1 Tax=Arundo donax TaxID=35708 RepID=A0A0A8ZCP9_ARUDO